MKLTTFLAVTDNNTPVEIRTLNFEPLKLDRLLEIHYPQPMHYKNAIDNEDALIVDIYALFKHVTYIAPDYEQGFLAVHLS